MTDHLLSREPKPEVYPGAPLAAVAIEVGFQPVLDAPTRYAVFERSLRDTFGTLVPSRRSSRRGRRRRDSEIAFMLSNDSERGIFLGHSEIAIVSYSYRGFQAFVEWALPTVTKALEALDPAQLERVAYRYENEIDIERVDYAVRLEEHFNVVLPRPEQSRPETRNVHLFWRQLWPGGTVAVSFDCCHDDHENARLDITGEPIAEALGVDTLEDVVRKAHHMARFTFEALITDTFREELRDGSA